MTLLSVQPARYTNQHLLAEYAPPDVINELGAKLWPEAKYSTVAVQKEPQTQQTKPLGVCASAWQITAEARGFRVCGNYCFDTSRSGHTATSQ